MKFQNHMGSWPHGPHPATLPKNHVWNGERTRTDSQEQPGCGYR